MNVVQETPIPPAPRILAPLRGRIRRLLGRDPGATSPTQHLGPRTRPGVARNWAYLLVLAPVVTDWLETGSLPTTPASYITEMVVGGIIAVCVALIHRDMKRLDAMAHTDALTGLPNRRRFADDLEHEVALVQRLGFALTLVFVDIDDFKRINDKHGHDEGDAVLRGVASLIRHRVRRSADKCYRIGGDEFVILLPGVEAAHALAIMGDCDDIGRMRHSSLSRYGVSLSCGVAQLEPDESCTDFMRRADALMYDAKHRSRKPASDG
jgi:diguanylate cyclase (GGDEF)-like protein